MDKKDLYQSLNALRYDIHRHGDKNGTKMIRLNDYMYILDHFPDAVPCSKDSHSIK